MPIGFAASILSPRNNNLGSPIPTGSKGYWSQTSTINTGNQRNLRWDHGGVYPATYMYNYFPAYDNSLGQLNGIVTNNKINDSTGPYYLGVTASVWFRGFPSDVMSNSILYAEGPIPSSGATLDFRIQINTTGIYSGANNSTFSAEPTNFSNLYLDGVWHHIWVHWRGRANNISQNRIFIDGVDKTTGTTPGIVPAGGEEMNNYGPRHHIGGAAGHGTSPNSENSQTTLDIADLYVLFADETNYIPNKSYWYNNGYVNLGNDGTLSGAPQPTLFVSVDSTDPDWASSETHIIQTGIGNVDFIVNGGKLNDSSFNDVGDGGSGQLTVYKSGGPQYIL